VTPATANAYLKTKVMTASPEELRLMLLDGAIKFARQGRDGLAARDFEAAFEGVTSCRSIVIELMTNVRDDVDPQLCERVRTVYGFIFQELTVAGFRKEPQRLDRVIELLEYERETWVLLMDKLSEERAEAAKSPGDSGGFSVQA